MILPENPNTGKNWKLYYEVRLDKKGRGESYGFDLTSMTSLRGHFIEAGNKGSRAEEAGMAQGDMIR